MVAVANQVRLQGGRYKVSGENLVRATQRSEDQDRTHNLCKEPSSGQSFVISEHRYIINHGIEDWLWQQRCGERLDLCSCIEHRLEWLSAHAGHYPRPGTSQRSGCCEKAVLRELWGIGWPAVGRSRMRNQSSDDRVMEVGVGIVVDSRSSRRLSHDCDSSGVSTESADVVSDPLDGLALVEEPDVCCLAGCTRESKDVETIAKVVT